MATVSAPERTQGKIPAAVVFALTGAAALPPLAIDMYLSSMPEISEVFGVPVGVSQLTLTLFLLVLGVGQLVAGPITDAVGRKKPLIIGLSVFVVGSVLAAVAPTMVVLLAARLIQGAGGAIAVVVANSSVRDHASGAAATRLYAVLMSVVAIAPIVAPTVGGFIDTFLGWRAVFWVLAGIGAVLALGSALLLDESLPAARRTPLALKSAFGEYGRLLTSRAFVLPAAALAAMFCMLFSYIGGSSYVYQNHYGLNASTFGVVFGASGVAMLVGSVLVNRLTGRFSSRTFAVTGTLVALLGVAGAALAVAANAPFGLLIAGIVTAVLGLGLCNPALMGQAMSASPHSSGQAAAVLGGAQFVLGAAATVIVGPLAEASALAWTLALVVFAALGSTLALVARRSAVVAAA